MKVFLSWSGQRSKMVAQALTDLLPGILQPIQCWMSEGDLPKGKPWFDELAKALSTITFAVVCVTKENARSPWMLWEAGFLSLPTALGDRRVAPLAIGFPKGSLDGPLSIYQGTDTTRDDILRLIRAINDTLPTESRIAAATLATTFDWGWPRLEERIQSAVNARVQEQAAPEVDEKQQISEILALLRQQQRDSAESRELEHRVIEAEMRAAAALQEIELLKQRRSRILTENQVSLLDDSVRLNDLYSLKSRAGSVSKSAIAALTETPDTPTGKGNEKS